MICIGTFDVLKDAEMFVEGNDARHVVWAIGEFFLLLHVFFWYLTINIGTTDSLKVRCGSTQATTTTTGPNDARRVVWALGEFFLIFFMFFFGI